jgi:hypothetical protein
MRASLLYAHLCTSPLLLSLCCHGKTPLDAGIKPAKPCCCSPLSSLSLFPFSLSQLLEEEDGDGADGSAAPDGGAALDGGAPASRRGHGSGRRSSSPSRPPPPHRREGQGRGSGRCWIEEAFSLLSEHR